MIDKIRITGVEVDSDLQQIYSHVLNESDFVIGDVDLTIDFYTKNISGITGTLVLTFDDVDFTFPDILEDVFDCDVELPEEITED